MKLYSLIFTCGATGREVLVAMSNDKAALAGVACTIIKDAPCTIQAKNNRLGTIEATAILDDGSMFEINEVTRMPA